MLPEHNISESNTGNIRKATYLVLLLDDERADSYESWLQVGWALHNIDYSLINTWIEFSKRSPKYKEGECEDKWFRMKSDGLSIRSLHFWARQDNNIKYEEYIKQEFAESLNKSLDGSTTFVAKALYTKFINSFVCVSFKNNLWFEFRNNKWYPVHDGYTLKKEISESFVNEYLMLITKYTTQATNATGEDKEYINSKAERVQKIVKNLMNITFKDKIMKEAALLFYDPDFEKKLNENYDLIGFNNGVYDLASNEFREGRPDDYISMSTNIDYYPYTNSNPYASKMFKFFKEILPNDNVRRYLLLSLSSCVAGHNKDEKLRIITGSGSNGKSLLFSLVKQALGDYYISCPITIITRSRNSSNSASPELARIKGTRCGCFQETDNGEKLNVGIMKEITGNDSFMVRNLYSTPEEIKPQIKFFLACNQLPELPSVDGGVKRRLCNILFGSKFVEDPIKPNEFLIDNSLKQGILEWAPLFISYLIHLYVNEYKLLQFLSEPREIKITTESYISENDYYTDYYINRIQFTGIKDDSITIKEIYEDFKLWYRSSRDGGRVRVPEQKELYKFLVEKIGETKNNKWKKYMLKNDEINNDDSESDTDDDKTINAKSNSFA